VLTASRYLWAIKSYHNHYQHQISISQVQNLHHNLKK